MRRSSIIASRSRTPPGTGATARSPPDALENQPRDSAARAPPATEVDDPRRHGGQRKRLAGAPQ